MSYRLLLDRVVIKKHKGRADTAPVEAFHILHLEVV